ncbi:MAG: cytochrome c3 family protein [Lacibacter sp.]
MVLVSLVIGGNLFAQDGKALFQANCAACHSVTKKLTGPALADVESRGPWGDRKKLYAWIHNPVAFAKADTYAADLMKQYNGIVMTAFPQLSEKEIDAIVDFVNAEATKKPETPAGPVVAQTAADNSLLFGILAIVLAVVGLILLRVNSGLKRLTDEREGRPVFAPIPAFRNKTILASGIILLFLLGGYFLVQGAVGLGRQKNYQPEQPIYYSHKVHAGVNQVNCLYCHGGAMEGKHANIPSVNVCMNCHMGISEYKGAPILKEDGSKLDANAEIQKLYQYAGWDPATNSYTGAGKPIEWVKIHSLPDHVYFNHSQHTKAGGVQCQTCHGEIQNMHEVKQFADLSMGWCINCHRTTAVKFKDNGFYSIYEKFHNDIKSGKMDSVTVENIGGTECQKCHY